MKLIEVGHVIFIAASLAGKSVQVAKMMASQARAEMAVASLVSTIKKER